MANAPLRRPPSASVRGGRPRPRADRGTGAPRSGDPYGLIPPGTPVAPILATVGLLLVGVMTLNLLNGQLPFVSGGDGDGPGGGPATTPAPSNVVPVPTEDPLTRTAGTIVYAKAGNVWIQQAGRATQLTDAGTDSMPSISPDGAWVYFVRSRAENGRWVVQGRERIYQLSIPALMRVSIEGGEPGTILDGRLRDGTRTWAAWIRQPVVRSDGRLIAIASDLPNPERSNVTLKLFDLETEQLTALDVPEVVPLGHQDPEWRPDGAILAYVKNDRQGATGRPELWTYTLETKRSRALTGPGYLAPNYSRDGRWIAATKTSAFGTDVVILEARTGNEVVRLTTDGRSWSPVWSPAGDGIAFLHSGGQVVDLWLLPLSGSAGRWEVGEPVPLTDAAGLDGASRPDWFIPERELPPLPTPRPSASAAASPSAAP